MNKDIVDWDKNVLYTFEKATVDSVDWDRSDPTHSLSQSMPSKRSVDSVAEGSSL